MTIKIMCGSNFNGRTNTGSLGFNIKDDLGNKTVMPLRKEVSFSGGFPLLFNKVVSDVKIDEFIRLLMKQNEAGMYTSDGGKFVSGKLLNDFFFRGSLYSPSLQKVLPNRQRICIIKDNERISKMILSRLVGEDGGLCPPPLGASPLTIFNQLFMGVDEMYLVTPSVCHKVKMDDKKSVALFQNNYPLSEEVKKYVFEQRRKVVKLLYLKPEFTLQDLETIRINSLNEFFNDFSGKLPPMTITSKALPKP